MGMVFTYDNYWRWKLVSHCRQSALLSYYDYGDLPLIPNVMEFVADDQFLENTIGFVSFPSPRI